MKIREPLTLATKMASPGQRRLGMSFANQSLGTYSPAGSPANKESCTARSNKAVPIALPNQSEDDVCVELTAELVLQMSGCGVLGAGIWLRLAYSGYAALLPQYSILSADSLCIAAGVLMFVIAFFGCCGAWFQNRCMLITSDITLPGLTRFITIIYIHTVTSYYLVCPFPNPAAISSRRVTSHYLAKPPIHISLLPSVHSNVTLPSLPPLPTMFASENDNASVPNSFCFFFSLCKAMPYYLDAPLSIRDASKYSKGYMALLYQHSGVRKRDEKNSPEPNAPKYRHKTKGERKRSELSVDLVVTSVYTYQRMSRHVLTMKKEETRLAEVVVDQLPRFLNSNAQDHTTRPSHRGRSGVVVRLLASRLGRTGLDSRWSRPRMLVVRTEAVDWTVGSLKGESQKAVWVRMEQHRSAKAEDTGYARENTPTSGIIRHDSHMRKSGRGRVVIKWAFTITWLLAGNEGTSRLTSWMTSRENGHHMRGINRAGVFRVASSKMAAASSPTSSQYFSLVIFMFVVEFLMATLAFVFRENLGHLLHEELKAGIEDHYDPASDPGFASIWTHIHDEVRLHSTELTTWWFFVHVSFRCTAIDPFTTFFRCTAIDPFTTFFRCTAIDPFTTFFRCTAIDPFTTFIRARLARRNLSLDSTTEVALISSFRRFGLVGVRKECEYNITKQHFPTVFHCCGVTGYEDWYDIKAWPGEKIVPDSCCIPKMSNNTAHSPPTKAIRARSPAGPLPDPRMWESCWTMPLVAALSWGTPAFPALAFQRHSILGPHSMSCSGMTGTYRSRLESPSFRGCCHAMDCGRSRDPDMWYPKGCAEQVQMWFVERMHIVGVVGLVVAFIQVLPTLLPLRPSYRYHTTSFFYGLRTPFIQELTRWALHLRAYDFVVEHVPGKENELADVLPPCTRTKKCQFTQVKTKQCSQQEIEGWHVVNGSLETGSAQQPGKWRVNVPMWARDHVLAYSHSGGMATNRTECRNQEIKVQLRLHVGEQHTAWAEHLPADLYTLRRRVNVQRQEKPPAELLVRPTCNDSSAGGAYASTRQPPELQAGQVVYVRMHLQSVACKEFCAVLATRRSGLHRVLRKYGPTTVTVRMDRRKVRVHRDDIRLIRGPLTARLVPMPLSPMTGRYGRSHDTSGGGACRGLTYAHPCPCISADTRTSSKQGRNSNDWHTTDVIVPTIARLGGAHEEKETANKRSFARTVQPGRVWRLQTHQGSRNSSMTEDSDSEGSGSECSLHLRRSHLPTHPPRQCFQCRQMQLSGRRKQHTLQQKTQQAAVQEERRYSQSQATTRMQMFLSGRAHTNTAAVMRTLQTCRAYSEFVVCESQQRGRGQQFNGSFRPGIRPTVPRDHRESSRYMNIHHHGIATYDAWSVFGHHMASVVSILVPPPSAAVRADLIDAAVLHGATQEDEPHLQVLRSHHLTIAHAAATCLYITSLVLCLCCLSVRVSNKLYTIFTYISVCTHAAGQSSDMAWHTCRDIALPVTEEQEIILAVRRTLDCFCSPRSNLKLRMGIVSRQLKNGRKYSLQLKNSEHTK
ncbi:hypothetical protein PR048_024370 [Dryococelus australis]|uniref:Tetraspanin n=1 Tax=Dryococelus australis TaxID=614101 RepID=A0ABQ9GNE1_9NEOP|nr:hypothetical protein PR048_024370 [Dryococelus australis]